MLCERTGKHRLSGSNFIYSNCTAIEWKSLSDGNEDSVKYNELYKNNYILIFFNTELQILSFLYFLYGMLESYN